jgi:hypothetical protein
MYLLLDQLTAALQTQNGKYLTFNNHIQFCIGADYAAHLKAKK